MKRRIALLIAACLLCVGFTDDYTIPSTELSADAAAVTGAGYLYGLVVITDGTNAVTVDVYDNTAGSGTHLIPTWVVTTSATDRAQSISFNPPVAFTIGAYVDITVGGGGTCEYMAYYRKTGR